MCFCATCRAMFSSLDSSRPQSPSISLFYIYEHENELINVCLCWPAVANLLDDLVDLSPTPTPTPSCPRPAPAAPAARVADGSSVAPATLWSLLDDLILDDDDLATALPARRRHSRITSAPAYVEQCYLAVMQARRSRAATDRAFGAYTIMWRAGP